MENKKYVYLFSEGNANMRELLGGKGANLAEMTNIGLPVPQGFTITTEACTQYYEDGREINADIQKQINEYILKMEKITGKKLLEIGCGLGRWAEVFHDKCESYLGLDYAENLIKLANEYYNFFKNRSSDNATYLQKLKNQMNKEKD